MSHGEVSEGDGARLRVVYMGTPDFAVPALHALHESRRCEVVLVVSQPSRPAGRGKKLRNPPVIDAALSVGIDVFQPEKLDDDEAFARVQSARPDLVVVAAYGQILKPRMLELPRFGCVNIHASLLPRWRGAAPIHWAIRGGDAVSGVSIMQMDAGLDTGPVYACETFMIRDEETAGSLHDELAEIGARALIDALDDITDPDVTPTPQPGERSSYAPMMDGSDRTVDFRRSAREVTNQINGMSPWPGVSVNIAGESVGLEFAMQVPGHIAAPEATPGQVLSADSSSGLIVACGENTAVRLARLKRAGKRAMDDKECLNGFDIPVGSVVEQLS